MKTNLAVAACVVIALTSGCASMLRGTSQSVEMQLTDKGTPVESVRCTLSNKVGKWDVQSGSSVFVKRDTSDMVVECFPVNAEKVVSTKESSASGGYMLLNAIMWDFCTISCIIDASTGALFSYPDKIVIELNKEETK